MHIQRTRVAGIIRFPDFFEQGLALDHFPMLIHQDVKQGDQARGQFCVLAKASHTAMLQVKPNGSDVNQVISIAWHQGFYTIHEFLCSKGKCQNRINKILVNRSFFFQNQNNGYLCILLADRMANADARASEGGGIDDNQARVGQFEFCNGLASILEGNNIKSLLLQIAGKRRDLCVSSFNNKDGGFFHKSGSTQKYNGEFFPRAKSLYPKS